VKGRTLRVRLESEDFDCANLLVYKLRGREQISALYHFEVELTCTDNAGIDSAELAGADVTLLFTVDDEVVRRVHGMVATVDDRLETEAEYRSYVLQIVPRMWRLTLIETLDIFIDMSVPDIVTKKLELVGLEGAFDSRLRRSYPKRGFVVQYKERDLDFASRLLEHLGVSYVFTHDEQEERVVFVDESGDFPSLEHEVGYQGRGEKTDVHRLEARTSLIPSGFVVRDYNYRKPRDEVLGVYESELGYGGGIVEYGAHAKTADQATEFARTRAEEREAKQLVYSGDSSVVALTAGSVFSLTGHAHVEEPLLLVSVEHELVQPGMMSGGDAEADGSYKNRFTAIPAARHYRPPRVTRRPRIAGILTGLIDQPEGASGRFPMIDDEGRYTVRFLFDTAEPGERKASHPVRLAQQFSGTHYGSHFPLRPGVEVTIGFIDGDPDRPIITGAVPNPLTTSPVTAKDAMKSRIRTESGIEIEFQDG
jgi:type VI secretion system secreted protein VgrG